MYVFKQGLDEELGLGVDIDIFHNIIMVYRKIFFLIMKVLFSLINVQKDKMVFFLFMRGWEVDATKVKIMRRDIDFLI